MVSVLKDVDNPLSPSGDPGLRIVHGVGLEQLTALLAEGLYPFPVDPFAPEVIVIPNIGTGDWLQREIPNALGRRVSQATGRTVSGILANFQLLTTHSFTNFIVNGQSREFDSRWSRSRLLWFVHRAIDDVGRDLVPGAIDNRIRTADAIADLFDRYIAHRPSMLQYWRDGRPTDGVDLSNLLPESMHWQTKVFARVCALIGEFSAMDALVDLRRRLENNEIPVHLPARVNVFGFTSLNPALRIVLDIVALVRSVNVFILHPVVGEWESEVGLDDQLHMRTKEMVSSSFHPLVSRWGRTALEVRDLVPKAAIVQAPKPSRASTLLGRVQTSLSESGSSPSAITTLLSLEDDAGQQALRSGDGSLQVHACHGRARQVEVLRDALLHCLDRDPSLHLHDILIVCPDLDMFAPIIPAIFRSGESKQSNKVVPLHVRLTELNTSGDAPVVEAFLAVVQMASSRCGVADVLGFLSRPVVMRRFQLDDESVGRLLELAEEVRIRFGIDGEHRANWGTPVSLEDGTWRFGLKRLMMGLAVATAEPHSGPGGVVPFDDLSVNEALLLGSLAEFISRLESFIDYAALPHTVNSWLARFMMVIDDMTHSPDPEEGMSDLMEVFDEIKTYSSDAGIDSSETFGLAEMVSLIRSQLGARSPRPQFRSGDMTVSRLPPVLGVPFRVIAVLGASETMFAASGTSGDDVLMLRPCLGEPNASAFGRLALLNVVLAAREALIITCEGADINTNKSIPLPVPLQELLEAAAAHVDIELNGRERIFVQHPRQNFDSSTMTPGLVSDDGPFTFDSGSRQAYEHRQTMSSLLTPILNSELSRQEGSPGSQELVLSNQTLRDVMTDPVRWFTRTIAQVRLESHDEGVAADVMELSADPLVISQQSRLLIELLRQSPEFQSQGDVSSIYEKWRSAAVNAGLFPPGRLGDDHISAIEEEVRLFLSSLPVAYFDQSTYRSIDVALDGSHLHMDDAGPVLIEGTIDGIVGTEVVRINYKRFAESQVLSGALDIALLVLADPDTAFRVMLLNRGDNDRSPAKPKSIGIRGANAQQCQDNASRFVRMAVEMTRCAGRSLVPVFPYASAELGRGQSLKARQAFNASDLVRNTDISYFFGSKSWDDIMAEKAQSSDPPGRADRRAQRYADFIWQTFDSTMEVQDIVVEADQH